MPRGGMKAVFTARNTPSAQLAQATIGKGGVIPVDLAAAQAAARNMQTEEMIGGAPAGVYEKLANEPDFPQATGWRLIIIPIKPITKTKGGILLTDDSVYEEEVLADVGYVASVGPVAFKDPRFLKADAWVKKGDWVNYGRLNGKDIIYQAPDGENHRLHVCNDKDVLMVIPNPNAIKVFVK